MFFNPLSRFRTLPPTVLLLLFALHSRGTTNLADQMQLGNPSGAIADTNNHNHFLYQLPVEAVDYNDNMGQPNWASWDLTSEDANNAVPRSDNFFTNIYLPPN